MGLGQYEQMGADDFYSFPGCEHLRQTLRVVVSCDRDAEGRLPSASHTATTRQEPMVYIRGQQP